MPRPARLLILILALSLAGPPPGAAGTVGADTLRSIVSILPVWPGRAQGGTGGPPGVAPEGSGVVLREGVVATAWHVIEPAARIEVRLSDGRILPARLIARDAASDIALLAVEAARDPIPLAPEPGLAAPVCAIGNAFGLGLSVTCGVVSALNVSNAGFNRVEDFVQTDAAINPGASGGALVDDSGRLVGMLSAIFAAQSDTNTGVGFAVSAALLQRVSDDLLKSGAVAYPVPGWRLGTPSRAQLARLAAPVVVDLRAGGAADAAGIRPGDLIVGIGSRRVLSPRDAVSALAVAPADAPDIPVTVDRDGTRLTLALPLRADTPDAAVDAADDMLGDCPHPAPVCRVRQAVFPVSSFDPVASATRIGPDLLVTNRHVVGDRTDAVVQTPDGPRGARVLPSSYPGDLVLLQVDGLPEGGVFPALADTGPVTGMLYAVGADVSRQEVRVFDPGALIAPPAAGADLGRLHVRAMMQPGVSGGALVDATGALVGIAVGGGEGRYEAIPLRDLRRALAMRGDAAAPEITARLGRAFADCAEAIDAAESGGGIAPDAMADSCLTALNHGQLLDAGRVLARAGAFDAAAQLLGQAVRQVPNSVNARISLLVSLQLAARFEEMTPHARWLLDMAPDDPQALRFGIQSGVWGGAPDLAEAAYQALLKADPRQAEAARRFIDSAPPAPPRRD